MTAPHHARSPLGAQAFSLEFPQSLGTFPEYAEVQRLVDALADANFPVENTVIVGTDLKLIERVTGRKSWGKVVLGGVLSGAWMGLFVGLLFAIFTDNWAAMLVQSVIMGAIFFTIWAVIGHAMSRGQRDFTSMTATIPMQYELLVEHRLLLDAQKILRENNIPLGPGAFGSSPTPPEPQGPGSPQGPHAQYGAPGSPHSYGASAAELAAGGSTPGRPDPNGVALGPTSSDPSHTAEDTPRRPQYGLPASEADDDR